MWMRSLFLCGLVACGFGATTGSAAANCRDLPSWSELRSALIKAVADEKSGLDFDMWGTIVDRDGTVCAVAFSGHSFKDQWLGSRVISAQKANTANASSLSKPLP